MTRTLTVRAFAIAMALCAIACSREMSSAAAPEREAAVQAVEVPTEAISAAPTVEPEPCGPTASSRALHDVLSRRAVEVVNRAARSSWQTDARLTALVAPSAEFSLGAGDVGRPLGTGPSGARALARTMNAGAFRFAGWDYMDMPADSCAVQKVEVEFVDTLGKSSFRIEFTFRAGRVVSAAGWLRSIESGPVTPVDVRD